MKKLVLACITALLLVACQQKSEVKNSKTIICGKVTGFEQVSTHDFIEIYHQKLLEGQVKNLAAINSNGEFRMELDIDTPCEFLMDYSALLTFYMSPGDSLFFEIDGRCQDVKTTSYADEYAFYKLTGTSEKMNEAVVKYHILKHDSLYNRSEQDSMIRNLTPTEYREFMDNYSASVHKAVEELIEKYELESGFSDWVKNDINFERWNKLMRYRWYHPMVNRKNVNEFIAQLPKDYFSFYNDWDKENRNNLRHYHYLHFLNEYYNMHYRGANSKLGEKAKLLYQEHPKQYIDSISTYLQEVEQGYIKDIFIATHYHDYILRKELSKLDGAFDSMLIEDESLRRTIVDKYKHVKSLIENSEYAAGTKFNFLAAENDYLQELIKKYPSKVLYLDFWAPWCGPCMQEMPNAKLVKNKMEGKDVVFVYLANRCSEDSWKATIAEKKIEGEHFFLNDKQFAHLSQVFGVRGIPHFAIIDKQGNIAEQRAPRPSSGDKLIETLDALL